MDRKLLEAILHKFNGGPVGIDNLAAAIGEERDTIEDVLEPFLIQQGYLQRTSRGRIATRQSYEHFGIKPPSNSANLDLLDWCSHLDGESDFYKTTLTDLYDISASI